MARNYYDPTLFRSAEESLNIYWPELPITAQYTALSTTYTQYKAEVETQYNNLTPLLKTICDYHMSALTEVVSSGITTDPDYWSASSINGSYIINSGLTTSRVGIGTMNPTYKLTVSGDVGVNEYIYHNGDADTYLRFTDDDINIRSGSLKNDMKKKRGHLYDVTFITFKKEATSDWYELNLIYTYELWMIDSAYKDNVRTMTDSYRCNLIN